MSYTVASAREWPPERHAIGSQLWQRFNRRYIVNPTSPGKLVATGVAAREGRRIAQGKLHPPLPKRSPSSLHPRYGWLLRGLAAREGRAPCSLHPLYSWLLRGLAAREERAPCSLRFHFCLLLLPLDFNGCKVLWVKLGDLGR